jgi:hypothetical protein
VDLGCKESETDKYSNQAIEFVCNQLELAPTSYVLIDAISFVYSKVKKLSLRYLRNTDYLSDLPTVRIIKQSLADINIALNWLKNASAACSVFKMNDSEIQWANHFAKEIANLNLNKKKLLAVSLNTTYFRPHSCSRDSRFSTFKHTMGYDLLNDTTFSATTAYDKKMIELIRTQRDEIDAIETFGNVLHDFKNIPFNLEYDLARFIWDEARHAEIGHELLKKLGLDPFEIPCNILGINVRSPMSPLHAFAQISLFGESNIVKEMTKFFKESYEKNKMDMAIPFDFITRDEILHIVRGRKWLKNISGQSLISLERLVKTLATKRLEEEGVLDNEQKRGITKQELIEIIGGE